MSTTKPAADRPNRRRRPGTAAAAARRGRNPASPKNADGESTAGAGESPAEAAGATGDKTREPQASAGGRVMGVQDAALEPRASKSPATSQARPPSPQAPDESEQKPQSVAPKWTVDSPLQGQDLLESGARRKPESPASTRAPSPTPETTATTTTASGTAQGKQGGLQPDPGAGPGTSSGGGATRHQTMLPDHGGVWAVDKGVDEAAVVRVTRQRGSTTGSDAPPPTALPKMPEPWKAGGGDVRSANTSKADAKQLRKTLMHTMKTGASKNHELMKERDGKPKAWAGRTRRSSLSSVISAPILQTTDSDAVRNCVDIDELKINNELSMGNMADEIYVEREGGHARPVAKAESMFDMYTDAGSSSGTPTSSEAQTGTGSVSATPTAEMQLRQMRGASTAGASESDNSFTRRWQTSAPDSEGFVKPDRIIVSRKSFVGSGASPQKIRAATRKSFFTEALIAGSHDERLKSRFKTQKTCTKGAGGAQPMAKLDARRQATQEALEETAEEGPPSGYGFNHAVAPNERAFMRTAAKASGNMDRMQEMISEDQEKTLVLKKDIITGYTALHWAAKYGNVEVIKMLLDAGADPDARSHGGVTPLHLAAQWDHPEVIKRLLVFCSSNICDNVGRRAHEMATGRCQEVFKFVMAGTTTASSTGSAIARTKTKIMRSFGTVRKSAHRQKAGQGCTSVGDCTYLTKKQLEGLSRDTITGPTGTTNAKVL